MQKLTSNFSPHSYARTLHETCVDIFDTRPKFLENLLESELLPAVLRAGRKPHWASSSFLSIISRYRFSMYLAYTFPGRLKGREARKLVHSLLSLFLCVWGCSPQLTNLSMASQNTMPLDTHVL